MVMDDASVIIAPNFPPLEDWAKSEQIEFASRVELVRNQKVQRLFEEIVAGVNQKLAHFETLKKIIAYKKRLVQWAGILFGIGTVALAGLIVSIILPL